MFEKPPEDLGTAQVLLVVAVVLAILAIGVVVLGVRPLASTTAGGREAAHLYVRPRARFGGRFS